MIQVEWLEEHYKQLEEREQNYITYIANLQLENSQLKLENEKLKAMAELHSHSFTGRIKNFFRTLFIKNTGV